MAIYERQIITTRTYEWVVPTGCPAADFDVAWASALDGYKKVHNLPDDATPNDGGWLRVHAVDDKVVLRFDVREETR